MHGAVRRKSICVISIWFWGQDPDTRLIFQYGWKGLGLQFKVARALPSQFYWGDVFVASLCN